MSHYQGKVDRKFVHKKYQWLYNPFLAWNMLLKTIHFILIDWLSQDWQLML